MSSDDLVTLYKVILEESGYVHGWSWDLYGNYEFDLESNTREQIPIYVIGNTYSYQSVPGKRRQYKVKLVPND